jgi:heme-degrading monooxygenase HmoA
MSFSAWNRPPSRRFTPRKNWPQFTTMSDAPSGTGPATLRAFMTRLSNTGRVRTLMPMICRLWRGWTTKDNADAYERIVRGQVIPGIEARRISGFRSIDLARRERDRDVEFMTLMWFDSLESVKEFMGEDYEVAHVPAEAQAVLTDFDKRSAHYEVLDHREQSR